MVPATPGNSEKKGYLLFALKFWYLTVNLMKVSVTAHDGEKFIVQEKDNKASVFF
jgi:hypothetical protein